jgi:hypothetical protein
LKVYSPDGTLIIDGRNIEGTEFYNESLSSVPSYLWFQNNFQAVEFKEGKYKIEIKVEDKLAGTSVSKISHFYIS